jgi:hypothetical protein
MVSVKAIYKPNQITEGAGVMVQRILGFETRYSCDPFLLLDFFGSNNEKDFVAGFPDHPHRGIETITYVLKGAVKHTDSIGNSSEIFEGDVQWMTAGSGIIHSEMPKADAGSMFGIQIWVNLPQEYKMVKPIYRELKHDKIPIVETSTLQLKIISGKYRKQEGAYTSPYKPIDLFDVKLWPDSVFDEVITPEFQNYRYYIFLYEGKVSIPGYKDVIEAPCVIALNYGTVLHIKAEDSGAKFLYFGGEANNEPIAWHGPIVMNTESEIKKAIDELNNGNFIK